MGSKRVDVEGKWAAGLPVLTGGAVTSPIELLSASRSLEQFSRDLHHIPDEVEAVMKAMVPHLAVGAIWRASPCMLPPSMWDRFVWPYFRRLIHEVVDAGLIVLLHLDSSWDRELVRFRELPEKRCIMVTDGETNLFNRLYAVGSKKQPPGTACTTHAAGGCHRVLRPT
jgi:hypothetical protein